MQLAYESPSPNNCRPDNEVFVRLSLSREEDFLDLYLGYTPILFREAIGDYKSHIVEDHVIAATRLKEQGFNKLVIGADQDGAWQKILSPRFSSAKIDERMADLLASFQSLSAIVDEVWVLLNVEELTPGGMDASDGVLIAQALEALGLKNIIASSGSKDFPPLYYRRSTEKKSDQQEDFRSHEPDFAASGWLLQHTGLKVWAWAQVDDEDHALAIARAIGLSGVIKKAHKIG